MADEPVGNAPAAGPNPTDGQQQLVDELIFKRDVNEGFLLIDYISGRSEKSLKDLDVTGLEIAGADPASPITPSQVLRKFCEIRYPPTPIPKVKAEDAAFVLEVKDRLNALARPARGITIAYTAIFVGNALLWSRKKPEQQKTLLDQAEAAFPNIAGHAKAFGRLFGLGLPFFLIIWFLLTAFTYWDIAYGGSIAQTIQQLENQRTTLLQTPGLATIVPALCKRQGGAVDAPPGCASAAACDALVHYATSSGPDRLSDCLKLVALEDAIRGARKNLVDFYTKAIGQPDESVFSFGRLRPVRWGFDAYNAEPYDNRPELSVSWVLTLFGAYILPAMFGLLGTFAAIVRVLQAKAKDSLIGPRDLALSMLGLLTGPLAGLAVGLFYTPPAAAAAAMGNASLAGTVTLTVSGLGFLAGYGADAFFKFLDALLTRVFAMDEHK